MQRMNEYRFYQLGATLERLKDVTETTLLSDAILPCVAAQSTLEALLTGPVSLRVCRQNVQELLSAIEHILLPPAGHKNELTKPVRYSGALRVASAVTELSAVLEAECRTLDTCAVSQKGAYSTPLLIDHAEILIPESTREKLDGVAIDDIRQAGRCLAFDLPTAAGFHLFRAVESVMHVLYDQVKGKLQKHNKPKTWFNYVEKLKEAQVTSSVTDLLNNIRGNYRNPVAHPKVTLTSDDAIVLLPLGVMAIQKMVEAMRTNDAKKSQQDNQAGGDASRNSSESPVEELNPELQREQCI